MPVVNPLARELVFKLVYYGPGLGGKTTSLQYIHAHTKPEHRGKMVSLATPVDRTLYFDFLPVRLPNVRGMNVRLQLFTVPGQVYYNATRKLVLTGADGVVMVVDSQRLRVDANLESLENLRENLREHGRSLAEVPHVIQYNKRDLVDILSVEELDQKLNRHQAHWFSTIAPRGEGVFEALQAITESVLADFQRRMPADSRKNGPAALQLPEGGIAEALRAAENESLESEPPTRFVSNEAATSPSGTFRLTDPGEDAARALTKGGEHTHEARADRAGAAPSGGAKPGDGVGELDIDVDIDAAESSSPNRPSTLPSLPGPRLVDRARHAQHAARAASSDRLAAPALDQQPAPAIIERESTGTGDRHTFAALFPPAERTIVRELERALSVAEHDHAVLLAEQLVARSFASAANVLGSTADAPRDPAVVCLLLGLDGRRYLEFRALVRDTRAGRAVAETDALAAYSFAIDARIARTRVAG